MRRANRFGDWVGSYRNGFGRRPVEGEVGPIVLRIADVSSGVVDLSSPRRGYASPKEAEIYKLAVGDLLFVRVNGAREIVGRCCVVDETLPVDTLFNDHLIRVQLLPGVDPEFARLCMSVPEARAVIETAASTSAGQLTVNQQLLDSIKVPDFPLAVQRRTVAHVNGQLAAAKDARQAAKAHAAEVNALLAAIYREAFVSVVPIAAPPEFVAAPAAWRWSKLADLARLESGHTPSRSRADWWGGDVSWVSLTEIRALDGRWIDETQIKTNAAGIANSSARVLPRGTVCFSRTASVGFVTIMGRPMATSQDFANWVCGDELDPEYLMHALIRARAELRALATGATHKTIYMPMLGAFHICMPERAMQERIVSKLKVQLAAIEDARAASQAQLKEIEGLPARLLAHAFDPFGEPDHD